MIRTLIAVSLLVGAASIHAAEPVACGAVNVQAAKLFTARRWQEFESASLKYAAPDALSADGVPLSYQYWSGLNCWMQAGGSGDIPRFASTAEYRKSIPDSSVAILVDAARLHRDAWAIRGSGYADTVSKDHWEWFERLNRESWKLLQDNKARTEHLPYWYLEAVAVGMDADIPDAQLRRLLDEGLRRFPGNFSLYFGYLRTFSSRWGGDYKSMDRFIREAAAGAPAGLQDVFYARLYWSMHQHEDSDPAFFADSLVDWPRMRRGLEQVMKQYPASVWNRTNLVMFACLNNDASTYGAWRSGVSEAGFVDAAPAGVTLQDCDRRLLRRA